MQQRPQQPEAQRKVEKRYVNKFQPDLEAARARVDYSNRRPDQPFTKKIRAENFISGNKRRVRYFHEDFQNVLKKMLNEHKTLAEVYRNPDMPSYSSIYYYSRRNKELKKALDATYKQLPLSLQAQANKLNEDKFRKAIQSFLQSGFSIAEISRILGVGDTTIRSRLMKK
jgi:hypothetical protein